MDIPEPEYGDDLVEWSIRFIDTTMNFGPIPEVKKNRRNWKEFVSNNFDFISNQCAQAGSDVSEEHFIELVDTYLISKPLPRKLYVKQDSYPVNSLSIEYHKEAYGIIVKQRPDDFALPIIRPLKKDWLEFWAKLDEIDFWDLGDNYFDRDILDGFWGDVHITYKNKKKVIVYNVDLPDTFAKLSKALKCLVSIPRDEEWSLF